MTREERLRELGYELPVIEVGDRPLIPWVQVGNLLYTSGRTPGADHKTGQVGAEHADAEPHEVRMRVYEARKDHTPAGIELLRIRVGPDDFLLGTNRDDTLAPHGHCTGYRLVPVNRVDVCIVEDVICLSHSLGRMRQNQHDGERNVPEHRQSRIGSDGE